MASSCCRSCERATAAHLQQLVEAGVGGDLIEPGPQRCVRTQLLLPLPGAQQRFLSELFGILKRAQHAIAVQCDRVSVRLEKCAKSLIAGASLHRVEDATQLFSWQADDPGSLASS